MKTIPGCDRAEHTLALCIVFVKCSPTAYSEKTHKVGGIKMSIIRLFKASYPTKLMGPIHISLGTTASALLNSQWYYPRQGPKQVPKDYHHA